MWFLYALLSAITAALVAIFGKLSVTTLDTTIATTIRSVIMTLFLLTTCLFFRKFESTSLQSISHNDWLFIIASGACGALSWLFYFLALKYGLVSQVVAIDRLSLVFAIIFSVIFLHESWTITTVVGTAFMIGGALLLSA